MRHWIFLGLAFCLQQVVVSAAFGEELIGSIKERAALLNDFKALLQDADGNVRLAAFDEGIRSDNVHIRTMTMEVALGGDDERLQTAGLRHLIDRRDRFIVDLDLPESPSEPQEYMYEELSSSGDQRHQIE